MEMTSNYNKVFILMFFAVLIFNCNCSGKKGNYFSITQTDLDDLKKSAKKELELVDMYVAHDTLLIASTNNYLYYPFGKFKKLNGFIDKYFSSVEVSVDSIQGTFKQYIITKDNCKIDIIENDDTGYLEVVSAQLFGDCITFVNNIKVGMNKSKFFELFFNDYSNELNEISVVLIESGLEGIWHYYIFFNNVLTDIYIKSDYQIVD